MLAAKRASQSVAVTFKIKSGRGAMKQTKRSTEHFLVLLCFGSECLSHWACVFCEPLVFTRVVNLHSALRYTEAPHHGNGAAGGWSAAASHKSTRKPETSVTPNAPTLNTHMSVPARPDQNRPDHGLATNPTDPIDLNTSSGSSELTQVECWNDAFFFLRHHLIATTNPYEIAHFLHSWGFYFADLLLACQNDLHVLLPVRVCRHVFVSMCVRIRISCGSDMGFGCDRRACKRASLCGAGCSSIADAQWFT